MKWSIQVDAPKTKSWPKRGRFEVLLVHRDECFKNTDQSYSPRSHHAETVNPLSTINKTTAMENIFCNNTLEIFQ